MDIHFIAPKMRDGRMVPFTLTSAQVAEHNAVTWSKGDRVFASFTPMRKLVEAVYVARTEQGHKVKIDGRMQYVSNVFSPTFAETL